MNKGNINIRGFIIMRIKKIVCILVTLMMMISLISMPSITANANDENVTFSEPSFYFKVQEDADYEVLESGAVFVNRKVADGASISAEVYIKDEDKVAGQVFLKWGSGNDNLKVTNVTGPVAKFGATPYKAFTSDEDIPIETLDDINGAGLCYSVDSTMPMEYTGVTSDAYPLACFEAKFAENAPGGTYNINVYNDTSYFSYVVCRPTGDGKEVEVFAEDSPSLMINSSDRMLGDVNDDIRIDSVDVSAILKAYANLSTNKESGFTADQMAAADVNGDGMVDAVDASNILAYYRYVSTQSGEDILSLNNYIKAQKTSYNATVEPMLTVSSETVELDVAKNYKMRDVTISVKGAADKYAPTGLHIEFDSRLKIVTKSVGGRTIYAKLGDGGEYLSTVQQGDGDNGFFVATAASDDVGQDGVLWKFQVILPDNLEGGEEFPIQIVYCSTPVATDLFTNVENNEQGQLMQDYVFTKGITQGGIKVKDDPTPWVFSGFTWEGNETNGYTEASAIYTRNDKTRPVNATLQTTVTEPTCESGGKTTYKAVISAADSLDGIAHESESKDALVKTALGHSFKYTVDGATITANCENDNCPETEGLSLTLSAPADLVYDGKVKAATLNSDYNKKAFPGEYSITYYQENEPVEADEVKNVGTYTAKVTAEGKTASVTYEVEKATATITPESYQQKLYGTSDPELKYSVSGMIEGETLSGTLNRKQGNDVGPYEYDVKSLDSQNSNYNVVLSEKADTFEITKRNVILTSASDTKIYDGKELANGKVTVSGDGFAEGEGCTFDVKGSQTQVGESENLFTYTLNEGTNLDNYEITTSNGKLTVIKTDSSASVKEVSGLVYDGTLKPLVTSDGVDGVTIMYRLGNDGKWQAEIPEASDAGTYKVYYYIKGDDNHNDDGSEDSPKGFVETVIAKATQSIPTETFTTTKASDDSKVDGKISGFDKAKTYQYSADGGKTWSDVPSENDSLNVKAGTYLIRYAENINYEAGQTVTVTVDYTSAQKEPDNPKDDTPKRADNFRYLGIKVSNSDSKINIKWNRISDADGYEVYIQYCSNNEFKLAKKIKKNSTTSVVLKKINGKKINPKKVFRTKVVAYKIVNGKKLIVAESIDAHVVGTKNKTYSNVKKLTLAKNSFSIKKGKTAKIKAKVTLFNKKKKHLNKGHGATVRYISSDKNVATVDKNGKIKAVGKGKCTIYVFSINGLMKKVKVTVN